MSQILKILTLWWNFVTDHLIATVVLVKSAERNPSTVDRSIGWKYRVSAKACFLNIFHQFSKIPFILFKFWQMWTKRFYEPRHVNSEDGLVKLAEHVLHRRHNLTLREIRPAKSEDAFKLTMVLIYSRLMQAVNHPKSILSRIKLYVTWSVDSPSIGWLPKTDAICVATPKPCEAYCNIIIFLKPPNWIPSVRPNREHRSQ